MTSERSVLVTGAGGFIGGRVVEALHLTGGTRVRAGVRRWASAARIGRFPVELAHCDVMESDSLANALTGVSAVVHCAVGDREVTVEGTRNLLEAARRAGWTGRCSRPGAEVLVGFHGSYPTGSSETPHQRVARFCHQSGLNCLDIGSALAGRDEFVVPMDEHWSSQGHRRIAELVFERWRDELLGAKAKASSQLSPHARL